MRDLADLRSAIKFWLEEYGFVVLTSETPDFPHALDREAVEACLRPIEECDYYILVVGLRAGSVVPDQEITVTRAEFRHARGLRRATGRPQMLHLVRSDVLAAWKAACALDIPSEEWTHITALLDEVEHPEEPGDPTFVRAFASFRDVVDALRATLHLSGPLTRRALEANLLWELIENTTRLLERGKASVWPKAQWLPKIAAPVERVEESTRIEGRDLTKIFLFRLSLSRSAQVSRTALEEAVNSGLFLDYDAAASAFRVGSLQQALLDLRAQMAGLENLARTVETDETIRRDIERLVAGARERTSVDVHNYTIIFLTAAQKTMLNVQALTRAIYRHLTGIDSTLQVPTLLSAQAESEEAERIEAEHVSAEDARRWLEEA